MEEHRHDWLLQGHLDGCHFFVSIYQCSCGAALRHEVERDFHDEGNPYSLNWARLGEDEEEPCADCLALYRGDRKPVHAEEVLLP